jgi:NAD(P)H-dependent FMN reductase
MESLARSSAPRRARSEASAPITIWQPFVFLNIPAMPQPEAYLCFADKLFDQQGKLINPDTRTFLQNFMNAFAAWVAANGKL